jgi:hypothetical protein
MKISCIVLCAAAAVPSITSAERLPVPEQYLGMMSGVVDFCARAQPEAAARYAAFAKDFLASVPEEELARLRKTDEYKAAYDAVSARLKSAAQEEVLAACSGFLKADNAS